MKVKLILTKMNENIIIKNSQCVRKLLKLFVIHLFIDFFSFNLPT